ncbi:hypothetical protein Ahy_A02g007920 isoform D [Arachis hypogaea]|uniref:Secreted protein n=1 Tax=Arachis hypogaea TaxID=3818 RepID=A0A445EDN0_ARAHY|nr:hypothetical protein Ahy_A02g007920 isoform D [Arachis hypogaea]
MCFSSLLLLPFAVNHAVYFSLSLSLSLPFTNDSYQHLSLLQIRLKFKANDASISMKFWGVVECSVSVLRFCF